MSGSRTMERVAKAIAEADASAYATPEERYAALARHGVAALKDPFREVNRAISAGQTRDDGIAMQLGYERGLDAVLCGARASMAGSL